MCLFQWCPAHGQRTVELRALTVGMLRPTLSAVGDLTQRHRSASNTKSDIVHDGIGCIPSTDTHPATPSRVCPTATFQDSVVAVPRRVETVPAPLPDIAERVEESVCISVFACRRLRAGRTVLFCPSDLVEGTVSGPCRTAQTTVNPFGFGRQSIPFGPWIPLNSVTADEVGGLQPLVFGCTIAPGDGLSPRHASRG
ncbi:Uncharacterised protein [Mycobacteroides abscessus subsp. bolletii]|nr:Uncharacterised protein [Mycobacteroides abscessus subsp. bolletii]